LTAASPEKCFSQLRFAANATNIRHFLYALTLSCSVAADDDTNDASVTLSRMLLNFPASPSDLGGLKFSSEEHSLETSHLG